MEKIQFEKNNIDLAVNNPYQGTESSQQCPSGPCPRCLAALPSNIEEIINEFKNQGKST